MQRGRSALVVFNTVAGMLLKTSSPGNTFLTEYHARIPRQPSFLKQLSSHAVDQVSNYTQLSDNNISPSLHFIASTKNEHDEDRKRPSHSNRSCGRRNIHRRDTPLCNSVFSTFKTCHGRLRSQNKAATASKLVILRLKSAAARLSIWVPESSGSSIRQIRLRPAKREHPIPHLTPVTHTQDVQADSKAPRASENSRNWTSPIPGIAGGSGVTGYTPSR
ncbi:hypothetical protein B0H14DRAFT_2588915 [Mycena olivaceomarginata]|nr:hypothetical protein B0H14DRAFT_2588915 [Mycena olivaceomarginata]